MSRVLLTGASGFIGHHTLTALLERGHEVHAVARHARPEQEGVVWHSADLLTADSAAAVVDAAGASHLLHLAWYAEPGKFWTAPENEQWVEATLGLLHAFAGAGGRRAVMAGSCAEYSWRDEPLDEHDSPLEPATLYGACKHATHQAAAAAAEELSVELAWGRVFFVYGPGESRGRLVSDVACGLLAGGRVPATEGSQRRDFLHVADVAGAFAAMTDTAVTGPVNVCSGEAPSIREVISLVASAANGLDRVDFGALPMRAGEPAWIVGRVCRLHEEIGFQPRIGLREGLAAAVQWWRDQLASPPAGQARGVRE